MISKAKTIGSFENALSLSERPILRNGPQALHYSLFKCPVAMNGIVCPPPNTTHSYPAIKEGYHTIPTGEKQAELCGIYEQFVRLTAPIIGQINTTGLRQKVTEC